MARTGYYQLDIDPANLAATNGICVNQTTAGAADLLLNGTLCSGGLFDISSVTAGYSSGCGGIKLVFDSADANSTAVVFTVYGKDPEGKAITETVTAVTTTAVSTTKFYSQVSRIAADRAVVSTGVYVGTITGELAGKAVILNPYSSQGAGILVFGKIGTCQFDTQYTFADTDQAIPETLWVNIASNQTTEQSGLVPVGASATRIKFDSYTNGAEVQFGVSYNPYR